MSDRYASNAAITGSNKPPLPMLLSDRTSNARERLSTLTVRLAQILDRVRGPQPTPIERDAKPSAQPNLDQTIGYLEVLLIEADNHVSELERLI